LPSARAKNLPIAEKITKQVLCLPIYPGLSEAEVNYICDCIKNSNSKHISRHALRK